MNGLLSRLRWFRYESKQSLMVIGGVAGLTLILGWNIFIKQDLKKVAEASKSRKEQALRTSVLKQIAESENEITGAQNQWAPSNEVTWLMNVVNQVAEDGHFTLRSLDPQSSERENEAYDKVTLNLQAQCSYHELGDFVSRLESYPKLLRVVGLQLKPSGREENGRTVLEVSMQLATHAPVGKTAS